MSVIESAAVFLIRTIFELYLYIVLLRLVMPWVRADYYHPLSQLVIKMTEPLLNPMRRLIPKMGSMDLPVILLLLVLTAIKLCLLFVIQFKMLPQVFGLMVAMVAACLEQGIDLIFFAILVVVIGSFLSGSLQHPVISLFAQLVEPYLQWFRKRIPPVAGFDFSPFAALVSLKLISIIVVFPIMQEAFKLMAGA